MLEQLSSINWGDLSTLRLLGSLSREAAQIIFLLVERFSAERDQCVQASLLFTLGALLARQEEAFLMRTRAVPQEHG